jgi:hypothetical protein
MFAARDSVRDVARLMVEEFFQPIDGHQEG